MADKNLDESVARAIEFDSTYPAAPAQPTGTTFGAPASNLQQLVTQTLQGVLGRSFKPGDHESFKAALNVSFEVEQVSGKNVYKHIPRAYPAVGASDIGGGISGAQYSLVTFAKALHQQTQPLLKNLRPLSTNVDQEDLEATKAIFTAAWDEFVAELSREGGPRASRADALADSILNANDAGLLNDLGTQLGVLTRLPDGTIDIDRSKVVTSDEEGHLTNFIALADYYVAVAGAWKRYRDTFFGTDLGSGLLMIERALSVVEDGVNQVYTAMDSVSVTQIERLIMTLGFEGADKNLTVEDLLSWIYSFASQEGPSLIRDGGRRGVQALIPTAEKLDQLTDKFITQIRAVETPQGSGTGSTVAYERAGESLSPVSLPEQFNHARVINPLKELRRYLSELLRLAKAIAPQPPSTTPQPETGTQSGTNPSKSGSKAPKSGSGTSSTSEAI